MQSTVLGAAYTVVSQTCFLPFWNIHLMRDQTEKNQVVYKKLLSVMKEMNATERGNDGEGTSLSKWSGKAYPNW